MKHIFITFLFLTFLRNSLCESNGDHINFKIIRSNFAVSSSNNDVTQQKDLDWATQRQLIPSDEPHPAGRHTHLTDTAVIYHTDDEPKYSGVSRYPPYIKQNGTRVNGPYDESNITGPVSTNTEVDPQPNVLDARPPTPPVPGEPLLSLKPQIAQVGGNQDEVYSPVAMEKQQPPNPSVSSTDTSTNGTTKRPGSSFLDFPMGLLSLGKALFGAMVSGKNMTRMNKTATTTPSPPRGVYLEDDARCRNYTVSICHQPWMKKHCPDMCRGYGNETMTTQAPTPAGTDVPPFKTTTGASTAVASSCCPCVAVNPCPCLPPPCQTAIPMTTAAPMITVGTEVTQVPEDPQCKIFPKETCNTPFMQLNCPETCSQQTPAPFTTTKATSECKAPTKGGNSNGGCCQFPFIYENTPIYTCLPLAENQTWCSTTGNYDKDGKWGECGGCIQPPCPTFSPASTTTPPLSTTTESTLATTTPPTTTEQFTTTVATTPFVDKVCDPWPVFGECSKTCGGGVQFRTRNCSVTFNNTTSIFQEKQSHLCGMDPCPINYTEWSEWTACVNGKQWRNRTGRWEDLGYNITLPYFDSRPCVLSCAVTSAWTEWGECTMTCDGGEQHRYRNCTDGMGVTTTQKETQKCNTQSCLPEFCGDWSAYSDCSKTCGGGTKSRWHTCGGSIVEEYASCNDFQCPTDNILNPDCGEWGAWGPCSATCNGMQTRYRHCKNKTVEFDELQARPCNANPCPGGGVNTTLAPSPQPTTTLTTPTISTTITTATPTPVYTTPPPGKIPFEECLVAYLSFDVVDISKKIVFDEGPYDNDFTYNGDVQFQHSNYSCQNAASINSDGDLYYSGSSFKNSPEVGVTVALWVHPTDLLHKQAIFTTKTIGSKGANFQLDLEAGKVRWLFNHLTGDNNFTVVTDAVIATYEWVHIAATYNATTKEAKVFINAKEMARTQVEPQSKLPEWNMFAALFPPVYEKRFKGLIDEFYVYNCSLTAEQIKTIADTCKDNGGDVCPSPLLGVCPPCENCTQPTTTTTTPQPPINGGYSEWSIWTSCSVTCGEGTKSRGRLCNNPEPQNGGLECYQQAELGNDTETVPCMEKECPIDGKYCPWNNWLGCNATCGMGVDTRLRECACPKPQFGGLPCQLGGEKEQRLCSIKPCPINGNYTEWTTWGACSTTCGNGTRIRSRDCTNPRPQYDGQDCESYGPSEDFESCPNQPGCPVNGTWTAWSRWSLCSRTCGEGKQMRTRQCEGQLNGGYPCPGSDTQTISCKLSDCCEIPYKRIGCYKNVPTGNVVDGNNVRPFNEMMFKEDASKFMQIIDLSDVMDDTICNCAKAAVAKKYTHFSIQSFSECWSGVNAGSTYSVFGPEDAFVPKISNNNLGCMDSSSNKCGANTLNCIGMTGTNFVYGLEGVTPIDGNYTEWTEWTPCSTTCGSTGLTSRIRHCTNPLPAFGGRNCSRLGLSLEQKSCPNTPCPIDGEWSPWSPWSICSVTVGDGIRTKQRTCTPPQYGGKPCEGGAEKVEICTVTPAPVDCKFNEWSAWGPCSKSCGNGKQERYRDGDNPPALYGGKECEGPVTEVQNCSASVPCPIDGGYTEWSQWGSCSKSCGGGIKLRKRTCSNPEPLNGGKDCLQQHLGPDTDQMECNPTCCAVDGSLSEWTQWSACDVTCGSGERYRYRQCNAPSPSYSGKNCSDLGETFEAVPCEGATKCPVNGGWGNYGTWTACSLSCGFGGFQTRQRTCNNPSPQNGGLLCYGDDTETRNCDEEKSCCTKAYTSLGCFNESSTEPALPELLFDDSENIDLQDWNEYLDNLVCRCANEAAMANYSHFAVQSLGKCYSGPDAGLSYNQHGSSSNCVTTGGSPKDDRFVPCDGEHTGKPCVGGNGTNFVYKLEARIRNGNYSQWSTWTNCSVTCGAGVRTRYRTCTNPSPAFGGKSCKELNLGPNEEVTSCTLNACPVDCGFTQWSLWTDCSVSCGSGTRARQRYPSNPAAANGGKNCSSDVSQTIPCDLALCEVNGNFSEWGEWSWWSTTCGSASRKRVRNCNNPTPSSGGAQCLGQPQDVESKNLGDCPVNGNWNEWSPWSLCSKTCGRGNSNRTRTCSLPAQKNGGLPCIGASEECKVCSNVDCPVDGKYTEWTEWTQCDKTCGNGTKFRSRSCQNPPPLGGGKNCLEQNLGPAEEFAACNIVGCPVASHYSPWSNWTECSETCGEGLSERSRVCYVANGEDCFGHSREARLCKNNECACSEKYEGAGCRSTANFTITSLLKARPSSQKIQDFICACAAAAKSQKMVEFGLSDRKCFGITESDAYRLKQPSDACFSYGLSIFSPINSVNDAPLIPSPIYKPESSKFSPPLRPCDHQSHQCDAPVNSIYLYAIGGTGTNGALSEWGTWGECSKSCGGGVKTAFRSCTSPYPGYEGRDCRGLGEISKIEGCNTQPCSANQWSAWSSWTACSVTCGQGDVTRTRNCTSVDGNGCRSSVNPGKLYKEESQREVCKMPPCSVLDPDHSKLFPWGDWTPCSSSCGIGEKHRVRNCTQSSAADLVCPCPKMESVSCEAGACPVNGNWGQWTDFTGCSTTCGAGIMSRTRECDSPAQSEGGKPCVGKSSEVRACDCNRECPVDGKFTTWSEWSSCDKTCGPGKRYRDRTCTAPTPKHGGAPCQGNYTQYEECMNVECPVDCEYNDWSTWSQCNINCGYGVQSRERNEKQAAAFGGTPCLGDRNQTKNCYVECCQTDYQRLGCYKERAEGDTSNWYNSPQLLFNDSAVARTRYFDWNVYLPELICKCATESKKAKFTHFAVKDLGVCVSGKSVSEYFNKNGPSTNCVSKTIDPSTSNNTYQKCRTQDAHCTGTDEKSAFLYGLTDVQPVDCGYTEWTEWSSCSKTCNTGYRERTRLDGNPPAAFGGKICNETLSQNQTCMTQPCPVNGNWSNWSAFTICSTTCGEGTRQRTRECNNPAPAYGGLPCPGSNDTHIQACNEGPCAVNGSWSKWTDWSSCSTTCGPGQMSRERSCSNPSPANGGAECVGDSKQNQECNLGNCTYHPGEWGTWSDCSVTCGSGVRERTRECPKQPCVADLKETEACQLPDCPIPCEIKMDVLFVVDLSGSNIGQWNIMEDFIIQTTSFLNIGFNKTRFAYFPFATDYVALESGDDLFMNKYIQTMTNPTKEEVADFVKKVVHSKVTRTGASYLNLALEHANLTVFNQSNGMRPDAKHVLILLADGHQDDIRELRLRPNGMIPNLNQSAQALFERGVQIISIGTGNIERQNLEMIANDPEFVFEVKDITKINQKIAEIVNASCINIPHWAPWGSWSSCSASCGNGTKSRERLCVGGSTGEGTCSVNGASQTVTCNKGDCSTVCNKTYDLGMIVNYYKTVQSEVIEGKLRTFLMDVASGFDISAGNTHFSFIPFSTYASDFGDVYNQWFNTSVVANIKSGDKTTQREYLDRLLMPDRDGERGQSHLTRALKLAKEKMFSTDYGMRKNVIKVLLIVTDGTESLPGVRDDLTETGIKALKDLGVNIIVAAIGSPLNEQNLATYTSQEFIVKATDYSTAVANDVIKTICNVSASWGEWGQWSACSASCGDGVRYKERVCIGGQPGDGKCVPSTGNRTQEKCNIAPCLSECKAIVDLGFIVDFSFSTIEGHTEEELFLLLQDFIVRISVTFNITEAQSHFAYIPFSTYPGDAPSQWFNNTELKTVPENDKKAQIEYLRKVIKVLPKNNEYMPGYTYLWKAMELADQKMFTTSFGMRENVKKLLVLITDGRENNPDKTDPFLQSIKNKGVGVISVAIGNNVKMERLKQYASSEQDIFLVSSFDTFKEKMEDIAQSMCLPKTTPEPVTTTTTPVPTTVPTTTIYVPYRCERTIDVVLLIDASTSVKAQWSNIKTFATNLVDRFDIGDNGAHFAIATYSSANSQNMKLDFSGNKRRIMASIKLLDVLEGSTRIDSALNWVKKIVIDGDHNRPSVLDVVVVITDGMSDAASEGLLEPAAKALKDNGTYIISVGLGTETSFQELRKIANSREAVFVLEDYNKISDYVDTLALGICEGSISNAGGTVQHNGYICEPSATFKFDLFCENDIYDESRKGNNGKLIGTSQISSNQAKCTNKVKLSSGGALRLNGSTFQNKPVDAITIAVWLNLIGQVDSQSIFSVLDAKNRVQYALEITRQGAVHFTINYGNKSVFQMKSAIGNFFFEQWVHLAVVYKLSENKGEIFIKGEPLATNNYEAVSVKHEISLLPTDWSGYTSFGHEGAQAVKQIMGGSIDEVYIFPCKLDASDISNLMTQCGRYEPRVRSHGGAQYEIFKVPSSTIFTSLPKEVAALKPLETKFVTNFEAPEFKSLTDDTKTAIGAGTFAAKLSGYFYPPSTGKYTMKFSSNKRSALFFNSDTESIESTVELKQSFDSDISTVATEIHTVNLKAGVPYYMVLYQLSEGQNTALKLGFDLQCAASNTMLSENVIRKTDLVYELPSNCSHIGSHIRDAPDDLYIIRLQQSCKAIEVYCHNMRGSGDPATLYTEYIPLEYGGTEENYAYYHRSRLLAYTTCSGQENKEPPETQKYWGQTWFRRVRINPSNMLLVRDDYTHAYTIGNPVKYGTAGDCYSRSTEDCRKGQFKINFQGTGVKVSPREWVATGAPKDMKERITQFKNSADWKQVSAHCGGSCSECEPSEGHIRIQPDQCIAQNAPILKRTASKSQGKRKWYSWLYGL